MSHIDAKYEELGGENGFLGKPRSEERWCRDHSGRHRSYEHGHIFWHRDTGAHEVHGAIMAKYQAWDWEYGVLGYPITDELDLPDGGRFNRFQKGLIVWTPQRGAKGICEDGVNIDRLVDFRKIGNTPYGNLALFYKKMQDWYGIDLRHNLNTRTGQKRYLGWQAADFWSSNRLNGYTLSNGERLIITVAQVLLMQWHLRDLKNHGNTRRDNINRYFNKKHCFKRNYSLARRAWSYNAWCSEFVSYVYKRAGIPVSRGKKQHFVCKGLWRYEKIGWCMSNVPYFAYYFKSRNQYKRIKEYREKRATLRLGDYLCRWNGKGPTSPKLSGHSMLVLGFEENMDRYQDSIIYIVNGNSGTGSPQGSNRLAKFQTRKLIDNLHGVGRRPVTLPGVGGGYVIA